MRQILAALALVLVSCLLLASGEARAQDLPAIEACVLAAESREALAACTGVVAQPCMELDVTTIGMVHCISEEGGQWRALLEALLARAAAREPERALGLESSQAAWEAWRESECSYRATAAYGGSAQQPMFVACDAELTADRVILFVMNEREPP